MPCDASELQATSANIETAISCAVHRVSKIDASISSVRQPEEPPKNSYVHSREPAALYFPRVLQRYHYVVSYRARWSITHTPTQIHHKLSVHLISLDIPFVKCLEVRLTFKLLDIE